MTEFIARNNSPLHGLLSGKSDDASSDEDGAKEWMGELDQEDMNMLHSFGSLTTTALLDKVKELQDLAYQLGIDESREMTRGTPGRLLLSHHLSLLSQASFWTSCRRRRLVAKRTVAIASHPCPHPFPPFAETASGDAVPTAMQSSPSCVQKLACFSPYFPITPYFITKRSRYPEYLYVSLHVCYADGGRRRLALCWQLL